MLENIKPDKFYTDWSSRYFKTSGANLKENLQNRLFLKNGGRSIQNNLILGAASMVQM